jgi:hypothetical protein
MRREALRGLVERGEMMQVQHVRALRPSVAQGGHPGVDLMLIRHVVHGREDAIRRARTILIGGRQGRVGA